MAVSSETAFLCTNIPNALKTRPPALDKPGTIEGWEQHQIDIFASIAEGSSCWISPMFVMLCSNRSLK
jgi:hypothetical protein